MKKCPNCGTINDDGASFCVNCGHDLSKVSVQPKRKKMQKSDLSRETYNQTTHFNNQPKQQSTNQPSLSHDLHNLVNDIKAKNGKRPWFKTLDGALGAVAVLLIIIIVELGIAISNLSDIDNMVGASHNQDDDQSYVIQHHRHQLPKLYVHHDSHQEPKANA